MEKSLNASTYIFLGEVLGIANNPQVANGDRWRGEINRLIEYLEKCGFDNALAAIRHLPTATFLVETRTGIIHSRSVPMLKAAVSAAYNVLYDDADKRATIALKISDVSAKLRDLGNRLSLNDAQKHLQEETIRCIECEAYRAGAVMAWGLAYDRIRRWMWDDVGRQAQFNVEIKKRRQGGSPTYPSGLVTYEDFYSIKPPLSEKNVLDAMKEAGLLTGVYDRLNHYLGERNRYAHANNLVPTLHQVNHYIDDLMDLITNQPFA